MKLTLFHKGLLLVCIPLCFEITIFAMLLDLQHQADLQAQKVSRNKEINDGLNFILRKNLMLGKMEIASFTSPAFKDNLAEIFVNLDRLNVLTKDRPDLNRNVRNCEKSMRAAEQSLHDVQRKLMKGESPHSEFVMQARTELVKEVNASIGADFLELADKSSAGTEDNRGTELRERSEKLLLFAIALSVLVGISGAALFTQHLVRRLNRLSTNAAILAKGGPLLPVEKGTDEVAELDRSFHNAADAIQHATKMRREVTAMITHDLKTPLQSIMSFLEMLHLGLLAKLNDKGTGLLDQSEKETRKMVSLIDSVLQLEKLRSKKVNLQIEKLAIVPVIDKSVDAVQAQADEKGIEVKREYGQHSGEIVQADSFWIEQVLVNILSNAIKFSPPKSFVVIAIRSNKDDLVIRISDKGPGIAEQERKLVFERFHRVKVAGESVAGSGLGLAISKELIEMHNGAIELESELGAGSTFGIRLPRFSIAKQGTI